MDVCNVNQLMYLTVYLYLYLYLYLIVYFSVYTYLYLDTVRRRGWLVLGPGCTVQYGTVQYWWDTDGWVVLHQSLLLYFIPCIYFIMLHTIYYTLYTTYYTLYTIPKLYFPLLLITIYGPLLCTVSNNTVIAHWCAWIPLIIIDPLIFFCCFLFPLLSYFVVGHGERWGSEWMDDRIIGI